jgi:hypothetical protein
MVEKMDVGAEDSESEDGEINAVWNILTPEQKKYFLKLSEKTEDNLRYIG